MKSMLHGAACVLLLAQSASCSSFRAFQHAVVPQGGHDGALGADQIYFELRNVKGFEDNGLSALVLPVDWAERDAVLGEGGVLVLEPPILLSWRFGRSIEPGVSLERIGDTSGSLGIYGDAHDPLDVPMVLSPAELDDHGAEAATRLQAGANAYALVLGAGDEPPPSCRLFGARAGSQGELQWVQLTTLRFEDSRGGLARALDVPVRKFPLLDIAVYSAALLWPLLVF